MLRMHGPGGHSQYAGLEIHRSWRGIYGVGHIAIVRFCGGRTGCSTSSIFTDARPIPEIAGHHQGSFRRGDAWSRRFGSSGRDRRQGGQDQYRGEVSPLISLPAQYQLAVTAPDFKVDVRDRARGRQYARVGGDIVG